uniref:Uncharacterized protein n=1 Tax=Vespula pensylvanica TaxID=30213 RepID=A0A834PDP2_VESPE|nr:hypothetical protein H0235_000133 [Vespula pensylvanica]
MRRIINSPAISRLSNKLRRCEATSISYKNELIDFIGGWTEAKGAFNSDQGPEKLEGRRDDYDDYDDYDYDDYDDDVDDDDDDKGSLQRVSTPDVYPRLPTSESR